MIRKVLTTFVTLVVIMVTAKAHDLFLKLDSYLLQPNSKAIVRVLNGTFQNSDGAVARERLADLKHRTLLGLIIKTHLSVSFHALFLEPPEKLTQRKARRICASPFLLNLIYSENC